MQATLDLQLLSPADWRTLRDVRLRALRDSPHAFLSRYDCELLLGEREWRQLLDSATWVVAREGEDVVGLARSVAESAHPWRRHIESMWVAPTHRRRGVSRALLDALADKERRAGVTELLLWVLEDNDHAQGAYATLGFEPTGERQFLPDLGRFERRFKLSITHPPGS
jgi:ribosomal protein S18 acetylase RimI-like enzyme